MLKVVNSTSKCLSNYILCCSYSSCLIILLNDPNSIAQPSDKNYVLKMNKALSLCQKHVGGLTHSDQPDIEGESYPNHLKECFDIYARLKGADNDKANGVNDRLAPVQNRSQQIHMQGLQAPLGGENGTHRFSTLAANKSAGHANAIRGNNDAVTRSGSDDEDTSSPDSNNKKRRVSRRPDPAATVHDFRESKKATTEALQAITNSLSGNKKPDTTEMAFKEKQLEINQSYLLNEQKMNEKKIMILEKKADTDMRTSIANLEMKREHAELKKKKADVDFATASLENDSRKLEVLTRQKSEAYSNLMKFSENVMVVEELKKESKYLNEKINLVVSRIM